MINAHVIGSGSKGNATIIYSKKTIILIDLGVDKSMFLHGLDEIGLNIKDIDFAFFTHNHTDHIKNFSLISREKRYGLVDVCGKMKIMSLIIIQNIISKILKLLLLKHLMMQQKGIVVI